MTTERDTDTETDGFQFRWWRQWLAVDPAGIERDYVELHVFEGTERLAEARAAHATDKRGAWVTHGMIAPHVTALRVYEAGRVLTEELAPAEDLDHVAEQPRFV